MRVVLAVPFFIVGLHVVADVAAILVDFALPTLERRGVLELQVGELGGGKRFDQVAGGRRDGRRVCRLLIPANVLIFDARRPNLSLSSRVRALSDLGRSR